MIGQLLDGRYQVIQVLGAGGFGQTYIARDTRRPGNPKCVVKVLKPPSSDAEFLQNARRLFTSEAETLEELGSHDQIPRLLAYQEQEFFLVQEYVEGHTLTAELPPGYRWEESRVIQLLQEVLTILEFVHSKGVIHRDIKPDNIIRRSSDNKLVLVDFGAVKQVRTQTAVGQGNVTIAVGTPGYMPTEQAQGRPRTNSDLYALGIIAIQALTGLTPWQFHEDPQTGEILWQHSVQVSPGFAAVLTRMTRYHFKDRYQSASEALQALHQLTHPGETTGFGTVAVSSPKRYSPPPVAPSEQRTVAAAPGYSSPPPTNFPSSRPASPTPANKTPLLAAIGVSVFMFLVGSAAFIAVNLDQQSKSDRRKPSSDQLVDQQKGDCTVLIPKLNVRSRPNGDIVAVVNQGTSLSLTGLKQKGWVEINAPSKGWISSNSQFINCSSATVVEATPTQTPTPQKSPDKPKPTPVDQGGNTLVKAKEKFQSGDLDNAIAIAQSIPANSPAYKQAQDTIQAWKREWSSAEAKFNQAQQAFNEGRWDDVLAIGQDANFPNLPYWRTQLKQLADIAVQRKAESENPEPVESPSASPSPPVESPSASPSPVEPAASPSPTQTPSAEPSIP